MESFPYLWCVIKIKFREVPAREGRASFLVVAGVVPLATTTKNGLMRYTDKKCTVNSLYIQGKTLVRLCKSNESWNRSGGFVVVSSGNKVGAFSFSMQQKGTNTEYDVVVRSVNAHSEVKFYRKNESLYMYYDVTNINWSNILGFAKEPFESFVNAEIDDTYKEITVTD